jgi:hypothetical protein
MASSADVYPPHSFAGSFALGAAGCAQHAGHQAAVRVGHVPSARPHGFDPHVCPLNKINEVFELRRARWRRSGA